MLKERRFFHQKGNLFNVCCIHSRYIYRASTNFRRFFRCGTERKLVEVWQKFSQKKWSCPTVFKEKRSPTQLVDEFETSAELSKKMLLRLTYRMRKIREKVLPLRLSLHKRKIKRLIKLGVLSEVTSIKISLRQVGEVRPRSNVNFGFSRRSTDLVNIRSMYSYRKAFCISHCGLITATCPISIATSLK